MTAVTRARTFGDADVDMTRLPGGVTEIRSRQAPSQAPSSTLHWLAQWAVATPTSTVLSEVIDGQREFFDYATTWARVVQAACALQSYGVGRGDRVAVIAVNSVDSFVAGHAAMLLGAIWVPIAPQYLRAGADPARLRGVLDLVEPRSSSFRIRRWTG
jgi:feruloyl-CoA synthase